MQSIVKQQSNLCMPSTSRLNTMLIKNMHNGRRYKHYYNANMQSVVDR